MHTHTHTHTLMLYKQTLAHTPIMANHQTEDRGPSHSALLGPAHLLIRVFQLPALVH